VKDILQSPAFPLLPISTNISTPCELVPSMTSSKGNLCVDMSNLSYRRNRSRNLVRRFALEESNILPILSRSSNGIPMWPSIIIYIASIDYIIKTLTEYGTRKAEG
jgi:hypothetical protein